MSFIATVCDVCGKPATSLARDTMRHECPGETYVKFSPVGRVHAGCDEHPAKAEEFVTGLPYPYQEKA